MYMSDRIRESWCCDNGRGYELGPLSWIQQLHTTLTFLLIYCVHESSVNMEEAAQITTLYRVQQIRKRKGFRAVQHNDGTAQLKVCLLDLKEEVKILIFIRWHSKFPDGMETIRANLLQCTMRDYEVTSNQGKNILWLVLFELHFNALIRDYWIALVLLFSPILNLILINQRYNVQVHENEVLKVTK